VLRLRDDRVAERADVSYGAGDRVLMSYEGISDLRDAAGNNLQTLIGVSTSWRLPPALGGVSQGR
jgi:hypothetical protein